MQLKEKEFLISGPAGKLQVIISYPEKRLLQPFGVVCHPHPLFEGSMDNKVVHRLVRTMLALGMTSVRFNFRGVGKSEGTYSQGKGETEDLFTVFQWLADTHQTKDYCLAGFSFGGYVAYRAAALFAHPHQIKMLITIAPAITHFDLLNLPKPQCPWIVVQGEQDEVIDPKAVYSMLNRLEVPHVLITLPQVGHFFHGQLLVLQQKLLETLKPYSKEWQIL